MVGNRSKTFRWPDSFVGWGIDIHPHDWAGMEADVDPLMGGFRNPHWRADWLFINVESFDNLHEHVCCMNVFVLQNGRQIKTETQKRLIKTL